MSGLRDRVVSRLEEGPATLGQLAKALGLPMRQSAEINRELTQLHRDKRAAVDREGRWALVNGASVEPRVLSRVMPEASSDQLAKMRARVTPESIKVGMELRKLILRCLADGPKSIDQLEAAIPGHPRLRIVKTTHRLRHTGKVEAIDRGVYRLAREPEPVAEAKPEAPHAEIRALLLRGAEAVLSGTLTKDGADALVELCDAVVAIDVGARA